MNVFALIREETRRGRKKENKDAEIEAKQNSEQVQGMVKEMSDNTPSNSRSRAIFKNGNFVTGAYWSVYYSLDAAAFGFAQYVSLNKSLDVDHKESSSILYEISGKDGRNYFSFTVPLQFKNILGHAPSAYRIIDIEKLLPDGAMDAGYIHNHSFYNPEGGSWGPYDFMVKGTKRLKLFLLNSAGELIAARQRLGTNSDTYDRIIATGFKQDPMKATITEYFDFGEDKRTMPAGNYYNIRR